MADRRSLPARLPRRRFLTTGAQAMGLAAGCITGAERERPQGTATAPRASRERPAAVPPGPSSAAVASGVEPSARRAERWAVPGPHPGRVADVHHPGCLRGREPQAEPVRQMLARAICELTGAQDERDGWRSLLSPGERIGLKVNPVGLAGPSRPGGISVISSPVVITAVVEALESAGLARRDFLLFERYRDEFMACGYPTLAGKLGIPWEASAVAFDETQLDLEGYSSGDPRAAAKGARARQDGSPPVSGYDPEVFVELDFVHPLNDPTDPRSRRSHLSNIVSRKVDKIINFVLMKDHMVSGVTGALKNMSHGYVNNVARTHSRASQNHVGVFTPAVVAMPTVRRKAVLHVMEAMLGIYHMGPWGSPNVWEPRRLLLATDPVALDSVAWKYLDQRRVEAGLPRLRRAGVEGEDPRVPGHAPEMFHRRSVEHVEACATRGLGVFPDDLELWRRHFGDPPDGRPLFDHRAVRLG